jgi:uncharacterized protein YuzE
VKASYDKHTDTLSIVFRPDDAIATSEELRPGLVIDFDQSGRVVSLEILDASLVMPEADRMEFRSAGA